MELLQERINRIAETPTETVVTEPIVENVVVQTNEQTVTDEKANAEKTISDKAANDKLLADAERLKETNNPDNAVSLLDKLKAPETKVEPVAPPKAEFTAEQLKEIADAKAVLGNPFVKAVMELGATPEQAKQIAKELAGTDYSKTSYAELVRLDAINEGLQGSDLDEAVAEKMEAFDTLGKLDKIKSEKSLRNQFQSQQTESPLLKSLQEAHEASVKNAPVTAKQPTPEEVKLFNEKVTIEDTGKITNVMSKLVDKDYYGVTISQADIDSLNKLYNPEKVNDYCDNKGVFNEIAFIEDKLPKVLIQKAYEAGRLDGAKGANKQVLQTGSHSTRTSSPVVLSEENKVKEGRASIGIVSNAKPPVQHRD